MTNDNATLSSLQQLIEDDAVGQLRRRDGLMATLGSEGSALKLDWVEGVALLMGPLIRMPKGTSTHKAAARKPQGKRLP